MLSTFWMPYLMKLCLLLCTNFPGLDLRYRTYLFSIKMPEYLANLFAIQTPNEYQTHLKTGLVFMT